MFSEAEPSELGDVKYHLGWHHMLWWSICDLKIGIGHFYRLYKHLYAYAYVCSTQAHLCFSLSLSLPVGIFSHPPIKHFSFTHFLTPCISSLLVTTHPSTPSLPPSYPPSLLPSYPPSYPPPSLPLTAYAFGINNFLISLPISFHSPHRTHYLPTTHTHTQTHTHTYTHTHTHTTPHTRIKNRTLYTAYLDTYKRRIPHIPNSVYTLYT